MCGSNSLLSGTRVLCLAIFLRLSGHVVVFDEQRGFLVFLEYRGVFNRCLGLMPPSLIFILAIGCLLSDGGNVFAEQPQAQRTN